MITDIQNQVPKHFLIAARLKALGKDQEYLAKKLKRSQPAISQALNGQNDKLLQRIETHVIYLERLTNPNLNEGI